MNLESSETSAYEVIFVSNGSSDNTNEVLQAFANQYDNFKFYDIPPSGGPAAPRNKGIKEANGETIIILDDDVIPDPDMLLSYEAHHRKYPEQNEAVLGVAYVPEEVKSKPVSLFHEFDYSNLASDCQICYTYFWTCNISFKREFMLQHGMFEELLLYNEDIHCGHQLAEAGMTLRFEPKARGKHLHQLLLKDIHKKGWFVGLWIWATSETLPTPEVLDRYGVLSAEIGVFAYTKRLIKRLGLRLLDNPITFIFLKWLGAESATRSKVTDFYYYLIYRRQILSGFRHAKKAFLREKKSGNNPDIIEFVRDLGN